MKEVPDQVVIAAFKDQMAADQALQQLRQMQKDRMIKIIDAAVLKRDAKSNLHVNEPSDWGWRRGAVAGGVVGAAVGLIAGPVGWAALGGAAIGGLASQLRDTGFNNSELQRLGECLIPNSSALVTLIEPIWVKQLEEEMTKAGAEIFAPRIEADIATSTEPGKDVAYPTFSARDTTETGRTESDTGEKPMQAPLESEKPPGADRPPAQMSG